MIRSRLKASVLVAFLSPIAGGCDTSLPVSPSAAVELDRSSNHALSRPRLAVCPTNTTQRTSGEIGPAGGSLDVAGHRLTIPAGALTRPTHFTLTAPAGRNLVVRVTAQSAERIRFSAPAAVTISYERCERQNPEPGFTAVWSINTRTDAVIASGETDPSLMTVTFPVELSSDGQEHFVARGIYAVAY